MNATQTVLAKAIEKEIAGDVEEGINTLFGQIQNKFNADGDASPELMERIEKVQAELIALIAEQVATATPAQP